MEENIKQQEQPVQKQLKKLDPNTRKIICCLSVIFCLVVGPLVITNLLKPKQPDPTESKMKSLDGAFRYIVGDALERNNINENSKINIQTVTLVDNYPNNFSFNICAYSDTKVYYYELENYNYGQDPYEPKTATDFLLYGNRFVLMSVYGSYTLSSYDKVDIDITTEYTPNSYVVGKSSNDENQYLFGYYAQDKNFHIFEKTLIQDSVDPFSNEHTLVDKNYIKDIYNYYYRFLDKKE